MSSLESNPNIPEVDLVFAPETRTRPTKLRACWSQDSADDLKRLLSRLLEGDYVLYKEIKRVVRVRKVATTFDMATGAEPTYEVEDVLSGAVVTIADDYLGEPLNEMEVLAHIRDTD